MSAEVRQALVTSTTTVAGKRRVLIIVENLSVPFDQRVWRECLALIERGFQVSVISPKGVNRDLKNRERIAGVSIYRYSGYQSRGGFVSYLVEYLIALLMSACLSVVVFFREGFDVVQICNPPDLLVLVALPFRLFGKKIIFDQHDLSPEIYEMHSSGMKQRIVIPLLHFFEKLTYACSDVVMVVNEECRKIAVGRGGRNPADVFIVRNAPHAESFERTKPDPSLKHGARYLLSYVGMMGPQDGIDVMLRGIKLLTTEHGRNDFHVLIMGSGTALDAMTQYARDLGLNGRVTFTGRVDYDMVMQGIASADVCLCPDPKTPFNDKCSLVKVVEYMSQGRPLVAFDLDEVRNSAGDAALYAQANDEKDFARKISGLLDAPDVRAAMGQIGRERVAKSLTWEHSKETFYAAYDQAFGN